MIHYGDICKLDGGEIPAVDVITGGSPCQDLSVAGLRKGILHEGKGDGETTRSGLFMEQIRIIKEMREADVRSGRTNEHIRSCRYAVWENVPGALSSGTPKGEDFRIVLEEFVKIFDPDAVVPRPDKWGGCGAIVGQHGSLAWRIHDAQYFGVPQRRRRVCVLCDFDGYTAPEILFDAQLFREAEDGDSVKAVGHPGPEPRPEVQPFGAGVSRDTEQSGEARQGTADRTEGSLGEASYTLKIRGGCEVDSSGRKAGKGALWQTEKAGTIAAAQDQTLIKTFGISPHCSNAMLSDNPHSGVYEADTSRTLDINGGSPACNQGGIAVVAVDVRNSKESEINATLQRGAGQNVNSNNVVRMRVGVE